MDELVTVGVMDELSVGAVLDSALSVFKGLAELVALADAPVKLVAAEKVPGKVGIAMLVVLAVPVVLAAPVVLAVPVVLDELTEESVG